MATVITRTVGPSGDYATIKLAEADLPNIGTSLDLVGNDEAIVIEIAGGVYPEDGIVISAGLNADAEHSVTFRAANDAQHGGQVGRGVHIAATTAGVAVSQNYTRVEGLSCSLDATPAFCFNTTGGWGSVFDRCVASNPQYIPYRLRAGSADAPHRIQNCIARNCGIYGMDLYGNPGLTVYGDFYNNTVIEATQSFAVGADATSTATATFVNNVALGTGACLIGTTGTVNVLGSNNIGGSTVPWPTALAAGGQSWTLSQDNKLSSTGANAIYDSHTLQLTTALGNDAVGAGIGPDGDSDVPTYDILGHPRWGLTTNPGAFQSLYHVWTTMSAAYAKRVDVDGVLAIGDGFIGCQVDVLSFTNDGNDTTAVIPEGTTALWVQVEDQTTTDEAIELRIMVDASTNVVLMQIGGAGNDQYAQSGLYKIPIALRDVGASYPKVRCQGTNASGGAKTVRVIAIGPSGGTWS